MTLTLYIFIVYWVCIFTYCTLRIFHIQFSTTVPFNFLIFVLSIFLTYTPHFIVLGVVWWCLFQGWCWLLEIMETEKLYLGPIFIRNVTQTLCDKIENSLSWNELNYYYKKTIFRFFKYFKYKVSTCSVYRLIIVTCDRSDIVVGGTLSEITEW